MSLLEELGSRKSKLRPTNTSVTRADGSKYWELTSGELVEAQDLSMGCGFVVDLDPDLQVGIISGYLILGSVDAANDPELLRVNKVTDILCTAAQCKLQNTPETIKVHYVPILDIPECDIKAYFSQTFDVITKVKSQGGTILVHCNAGVSRSATIVIAYLMRAKDMSFCDAFELVKSKRPCICPNTGFLQQLKCFEKEFSDNC